MDFDIAEIFHINSNSFVFIVLERHSKKQKLWQIKLDETKC